MEKINNAPVRVRKKALFTKAQKSREICQKTFLVQVRLDKEEIMRNNKWDQVLVYADDEREAKKFAIWQYANYIMTAPFVHAWNRTTTWQDRTKFYTAG